MKLFIVGRSWLVFTGRVLGDDIFTVLVFREGPTGITVTSMATVLSVLTKKHKIGCNCCVEESWSVKTSLIVAAIHSTTILPLLCRNKSPTES